MCVMSCPYGMARPSTQDNRHMVKCDLCEGRETMACTEVCPTGCLKTVERNADRKKAIEILLQEEQKIEDAKK